MAATCRRSIGFRHCSHLRTTLKVCWSTLLALVLLLQQSSFFCDAYGYADFIAAYNNPAVTYHEVKGNVVLPASLPPLSRALTLVGKHPLGGSHRPVIDGVSKYRGIVTGDDIKFVNLEFKRFKASDSGPVLTASGSNVIIEKCAFLNNEATGSASSGGALNFYSVGYKITKSVFSGNKAGGAGGAIWTWSDGSGPIEDTIFENNSAKSSGGAVASKQEIGLRFNRCRFVNNRAGDFGGAAYFNRPLVTVSNSHFIGNAARTFGGAFRFFGNDEGILRVCRGNVFQNNRAGNSTSNNISIDLAELGPPPNVFFCKPKPPGTLIVSPGGGVAQSCQYC